MTTYQAATVAVPRTLAPSEISYVCGTVEVKGLIDVNLGVFKGTVKLSSKGDAVPVMLTGDSGHIQPVIPGPSVRLFLHDTGIDMETTGCGLGGKAAVARWPAIPAEAASFLAPCKSVVDPVIEHYTNNLGTLGGGISAMMVSMPAANSSEWHAHPGETVLIVLEGEAKVEVLGAIANVSSSAGVPAPTAKGADLGHPPGTVVSTASAGVVQTTVAAGQQLVIYAGTMRRVSTERGFKAVNMERMCCFEPAARPSAQAPGLASAQPEASPSCQGKPCC